MKNPPTRYNKTELSRLLPSSPSLPTLSRYLKMAGSPKPDRNGKYNASEVEKFLAVNAPRLAARMDPKMLALKRRLLELAVEEAEGVAAAKRGETVLVDTIAPDLEALAIETDRSLRHVFQELLPSRCAGKTASEILEINRKALDKFAADFKSGATKIEAKARQIATP